MTTAFDDTGQHPVTSAIAAVSQLLREVADLGLWTLRPAETEANLTALAQLRHQITELELRHAHHADRLDLGAQAGAADTGSYWANPTRQTKRDAKRRLALAHALDHDHEPVRDAMAAGQVSEEQAVVIVKGVDALPVEHRRDAEAHLIGFAAEHDPVALRRLAHHVLEVVAPEIAEEHELKALQRQEALAEEACRFTIADDGHGLCHGRFTLPAPVGAMLKQAVLAINSPKHRRHSGTPKGLGHAFCEYVTRYPIDRLPQAGGVDATVVVTMTLENLLGDSQAPAVLDTGDPITADQARKLACEAGIIPMVLGGKSEILDLGRRKRLYDRYQRIAIRHRDQHCTAQGCDWPAAMCHVHHNIPWSRGGKTNIDDGRLLCPRHHSYAHSPEVRDEDHPQRTRRLQPHVGRTQPGKATTPGTSGPSPSGTMCPWRSPRRWSRATARRATTTTSRPPGRRGSCSSGAR